MKNTRLSMVRPGGRGGGFLPSYRLMGMCRWIGSTGLTIMGLRFP